MQISNPPIMFVLIAAGIYLGHLILHGSLPPCAICTRFIPPRGRWASRF